MEHRHPDSLDSPSGKRSYVGGLAIASAIRGGEDGPGGGGGTMSLLADHNMPFAAALLLMVMLAIAQAAGLGGFEADADGDLDGGGDVGPMDGLLTVIGIGRLPFMMWLALFLLLFAAIGVGLQSLAASLAGGPLDVLLASVLGGVAALPVAGALARPIAAVMPKDETTAITTDALVGRRARISTGWANARSAVSEPRRYPSPCSSRSTFTSQPCCPAAISTFSRSRRSRTAEARLRARNSTQPDLSWDWKNLRSRLLPGPSGARPRLALRSMNSR